jgi:hypothetical protein
MHSKLTESPTMVPETGQKFYMQNRIAKIEGSQIQKQASWLYASKVLL